MTVKAMPETIGPYNVLSRLGSGGMGVVYLARSPTGSLVAVKVMDPAWTSLAEFPERFRREVDAARRVARFCTAAVLDAALTEDSAYLVTEYVPGPTLTELVKGTGPLTGSPLESVAVGIAVALNAMHGAGVAHRDLKPSNVLLSPYGPRVIDFGIAQLAESVTAPSETVLGTPAYMAPEHARGEAAGPAADIFSWGAVVAYAGTGNPPFGRGTTPDVLYRVVFDPPDLTGLDAPLRDLVAWAMAKSADERPTAAQLLASLVGSPMTVESATRVAQRTWTRLPANTRGPWAQGRPDPAADGSAACDPADPDAVVTAAGPAATPQTRDPKSRVAAPDRPDPTAGERAATPDPAGPTTSRPPRTWRRVLGTDPASADVEPTDRVEGGSRAAAAAGGHRTGVGAGAAAAAPAPDTRSASSAAGPRAVGPVAGVGGAAPRAWRRLGWSVAAVAVLLGGAAWGGVAGAKALRPQHPAPVLLSDAFRQRTGWAEADTAAGRTSFATGGYRIEVKAGQGLVPTAPVDTSRLTDVTVSATVRLTGTGAAGVWCRGNPPALSTDRYDFYLTSAGEVAIIKQGADGANVELAPYRPITPPAGPVALQARCRDIAGGVRLELSVNGRLTARADDRTAPYGPGAVGVAGYATAAPVTLDVTRVTVAGPG